MALLALEHLPSVASSSALYASRLYLGRYQITHPERLAKHTPGGPRIRGTHPAPVVNLCPSLSPTAFTPDLRSRGESQPLPFPIQIMFGVFGPRSSLLLLGNVYIHPTAKVAPSAVVSGGPSPRERKVAIGLGWGMGYRDCQSSECWSLCQACHAALSRLLPSSVS